MSDEKAATGADCTAGPTVWSRATSTAYVESPERVVVLDLSHLDLPPFVFDGTAAQVWSCLDGDRSEAELVADLAAAYEVAAGVVEPDVMAFVGRLADLGLIVRHVGTGDGS